MSINFKKLKQHQLLAITESVKNKVKVAETEIYKNVQKEASFQGLSRVFRPLDENGYVYPPESKKVQNTVAELVKAFNESTIELFDVLGTQDATNQVAKADIIIEGVTLVKDVPISHLLFLESQIKTYITFFKSLPTLDSSEEWFIDQNTGLYVTQPTETNKTKKITDWKVIEGTLTDKHPAQVKEFSQDINEGKWSQTKFSGAIYQTTKTKLIKRAEELLSAVLISREQANSIEVVPFKTGEILTNYLVKDLI